jgi:opacity protein-like surface antigen
MKTLLAIAASALMLAAVAADAKMSANGRYLNGVQMNKLTANAMTFNGRFLNRAVSNAMTYNGVERNGTFGASLGSVELIGVELPR